MQNKTLISFQLPETFNDQLRIIKKKYIDSGMKYGWKSSWNTYDQGHWNKSILVNSNKHPFGHDAMPFLDEHPEIKEIWEVIKQAVGPRELLRCYINGYTYGTDGYAHQDDVWVRKTYGSDTFSETVLVYLNETWHHDWAGETVFYDDDYEIKLSVLPKFGKTVIFDSEIFHSARPVSRIFTGLRTVLAFKTVDSKINSPQVQFILEKTQGHKHSGKSFFEHLYNTMLILESDRSNSRDLCIAGLYHSIYGTEYYEFKDNSITRETIKDLIGDRAEELVFTFCTTVSKQRAFIDNTGNWDEEFRQDLLRLEAANLREQSVSFPNLAEKIIELEKEIISRPKVDKTTNQ